MSNKVSLKIITPEGIFWNKPVDIVTVKTTEGYIGLQYNRSPFVASLDIAELEINSSSNNKEHKICAIAGGIVMTSKNEINIITDAIEFKENIDNARAERARKAAEATLKRTASEEEKFQAELSLKKAINRIQIRTRK